VNQLPRLLLVSLAAALSLSACTDSGADPQVGSKTTSAGPTSPQPASATATSDVAPRPQVGNCYDVGKAAFRRQRDGSKPVHCKKRHTAETFAVFRAGTVPMRSTTNRVWRKCQARFTRYVGASTTVSTIRLTVILPSHAQNAAGQGWIRCDAIQLPNYAGHSGVPRAGSVEGVLSDRVPRALRGCARHWPKVDQPVHFTSCTRRHQAELIPESANLGRPEAEYPGRRTVKRNSRHFCGGLFQRYVPQTRHFYYYYPTRSSWRSSTHATTCWALDPRGDGLPPI
jgi:Septum formation